MTNLSATLRCEHHVIREADLAHASAADDFDDLIAGLGDHTQLRLFRPNRLARGNAFNRLSLCDNRNAIDDHVLNTERAGDRGRDTLTDR